MAGKKGKSGLSKGRTNNPYGRPTGTPNRITADVRASIKQLVDENLEQIKADFATLEPKDRLIIFERLLQYCIPKKRDEPTVDDNSFAQSEMMKRLFGSQAEE